MPRPARYTVDVLLDAAAELLAADGPAAVTMSAVARTHRRAEWLGVPPVPDQGRVVRRAVGAYRGAVPGTARSRRCRAPSDPQQRCVAGALRIVQWCREHPSRRRCCSPGPTRSGWGSGQSRSPGGGNACSASSGRCSPNCPTIRAGSTRRLIDVPYAIVRRHLRARQAIPASADSIVADCARALIAAG